MSKYCCYRFEEWVEEGLLKEETPEENGEEYRYFISAENQLNKGIYCHARFFYCPFCGKKINMEAKNVGYAK